MGDVSGRDPSSDSLSLAKYLVDGRDLIEGSQGIVQVLAPEEERFYMLSL